MSIVEQLLWTLILEVKINPLSSNPKIVKHTQTIRRLIAVYDYFMCVYDYDYEFV